MKMYVFEYIDQLTNNWHPEGGLIVVAKDREQVIELIKDYGGIKISDKEWKDVTVYELRHQVEPTLYVFPDAGCC